MRYKAKIEVDAKLDDILGETKALKLVEELRKRIESLGVYGLTGAIEVTKTKLLELEEVE